MTQKEVIKWIVYSKQQKDGTGTCVTVTQEEFENSTEKMSKKYRKFCGSSHEVEQYDSQAEYKGFETVETT